MMRFGLVIPNDFPPGTVPAEMVEGIVSTAQAAEDAGFAHVWMLQHYLSNMPTLQPLPTLALVAGATRRIGLGTNIFILPLHPTIEVAEQFATLDHLSGGRCIAGLGLGYRQPEFDAFGVDLDERVARFEEGARLLRRLWAGEEVTFSGEHHRFEEVRLSMPTLQARMPLWVGAGAHETGVRRAARCGDAWIVPPHTPVERIAALYGPHREEQQRQGRPEAPRYVVRRELLLHEDAEVAFETGVRVRGDVSEQYAAYNTPNRTRDYRHLADGTVREGVREVAANAYLFTDPATCRDRLDELAAIGVTDVLLRMQWSDLPTEAVARSMQLFVEQVMPAFSAQVEGATRTGHEVRSGSNRKADGT